MKMNETFVIKFILKKKSMEKLYLIQIFKTQKRKEEFS